MAKQRYPTDEIIHKLRETGVLTFVWLRCCVAAGSSGEYKVWSVNLLRLVWLV